MSQPQGLNNPAATMAVAEFANSKTGQDTIKATGNALKVLLIIGGTIGTAFVANKLYKKWRSNKYLTKNAAKPSVQVAVMMYSAMHKLPTEFGFVTFNIWDGTNEDLLKHLARKDVDLNEVSRDYKIIFDRVLINDVKSELSGTEIWEFFSNVNSTGSDTTTPASDLVPYLKGEPAFVRKKHEKLQTKKAVKQDNGAWLISNDSRGLFVFGDKIGYIYDVVKHADGEIDYIIDQDYSLDSIYGYTVANHRDILNQDPENQ